MHSLNILVPVSYTHLDVYKRQLLDSADNLLNDLNELCIETADNVSALSLSIVFVVHFRISLTVILQISNNVLQISKSNKKVFLLEDVLLSKLTCHYSMPYL